MTDLLQLAASILARPYRPRDAVADEATWKRLAQECLDGECWDFEALLDMDAAVCDGRA